MVSSVIFIDPPRRLGWPASKKKKGHSARLDQVYVRKEFGSIQAEGHTDHGVLIRGAVGAAREALPGGSDHHIRLDTDPLHASAIAAAEFHLSGVVEDHAPREDGAAA